MVENIYKKEQIFDGVIQECFAMIHKLNQQVIKMASPDQAKQIMVEFCKLNEGINKLMDIFPETERSTRRSARSPRLNLDSYMLAPNALGLNAGLQSP